MKPLQLSALIVLSFAAFGTIGARAEPTEHIVEIVSDFDTMEMAFKPKFLRIEPGDTVTWVNTAAMDHNVITFPNGHPKGSEGFESPYLSQKGDSWSYTFTAPGTYEYHCLPHLSFGMHGSVVAGRASEANEFHQPTSEEVLAYRNKLLEFFDESDIEDMRHATHETESSD